MRYRHSAAALALGVCTLVFAAFDARGALAQNPTSPEAPTEIVLEAMEPQELPGGRCGMFLWTRAATPELVMVAFANPIEARVRAGGRYRFLRRTAFGAEMAFGLFEKQTFTDGRVTIEVDVTFDNERGLRNGAVVKAGVIRTREPNRWESVTPVGGLIACQS